ncbi:MAG: CvpA family protein, partial [Herpetosiphon sp.]|nr:CvpA family protein [Herpetosiphon sp.]
MSIVLDVLIIGSLLTLGVVGLSRGFQRELVALFGILFGALVTEVGAQNWGYARAIQMERDPNLMTVMIAIGMVLGSAVLLGYGGALFLPARKKPAEGTDRWLGGLVATINGILLLGLVLRYASWRENSWLLSKFTFSDVVLRNFPTFLFAMFVIGCVVALVRIGQHLFTLMQAR